MTDKCRGGPTEWQGERPLVGTVLSIATPFPRSSFDKCIKNHKLKNSEMPLFWVVSSNATKHKYINNIVIINPLYIVSGFTYSMSQETAADYGPKSEKCLDKWSLQSNGKSIWNPINHGTGDWLKEKSFSNGLLWDPDKIIDCEAVKIAWLRRCIDRKSKVFHAVQLL